MNVQMNGQNTGILCVNYSRETIFVIYEENKVSECIQHCNLRLILIQTFAT